MCLVRRAELLGTAWSWYDKEEGVGEEELKRMKMRPR